MQKIEKSYRKKLLTALVLIPLCISFIGCATIMDGSTQAIGFSSNPTNALVTVDGEVIGNTPLTKDLERKETHTVLMTLEGYQPYEITLKQKSNGWVWGNILFGGIIGLIVDVSTGAMYKLTPEQVEANLKRNGTASIKTGEDVLYIAVTLKPSASWEKIGNMKRF